MKLLIYKRCNYDRKEKVSSKLIIIIGMISIVIGVYIIVSTKNKNDYYTKEEEKIQIAAKKFLKENQTELPKLIGTSQKIQLDKLIDNGYLEKIVDYKNDTCDLNKSYVIIYKESESNYKYGVYLNCENYTSEYKKIESLIESANIDIVYYKDNEQTKYNPDTAKIYLTKEYNKIEYTIYNSQNKEEEKGELKQNKTTYEISNINNYKDGNYIIRLNLTAKNGKEITYDSEYIIDTKAPTCKNQEINIDGKWVKWNDDIKWTKQGRSIRVSCEDKNGSGCTSTVYSKTFTSKEGIIKTDNISIQDKAGNKATCKVNVLIDNESPSCGKQEIKKNNKWIEINNTDSYSLDNKEVRTLCNDGEGSGCTAENYSTNLEITNTEMAQGTIIIKDKLGNEKICPINIKLKRNNNTSGNNSSNNNNNTNNNTGGNNNTDNNNTNNNNNNEEPVDKPENIKFIYYKKGKETKYNPDTVEIYVTKKYSAFTYVMYDSYNQKYKTIKLPMNGNKLSINGLDEHNIDGQYSIEVKFVTATGKEVQVSSQYELDKTAPICGTVEYKNDDKWLKNINWTNQNREIRISCDDKKGSGCMMETYYKTFSSVNETIKTSTIEIQDQAGNSTECPVDVYIDKEAPICKNSMINYNNQWMNWNSEIGWTNNERLTKITCTDNEGSGCTENEYYKTFSITNRILKNSVITISDKVGNTQLCPVDIYIDNELPKCKDKKVLNNNQWVTWTENIGWTK